MKNLNMPEREFRVFWLVKELTCLFVFPVSICLHSVSLKDIAFIRLYKGPSCKRFWSNHHSTCHSLEDMKENSEVHKSMRGITWTQERFCVNAKKLWCFKMSHLNLRIVVIICEIFVTFIFLYALRQSLEPGMSMEQKHTACSLHS